MFAGTELFRHRNSSTIPRKNTWSGEFANRVWEPQLVFLGNQTPGRVGKIPRLRPKTWANTYASYAVCSISTDITEHFMDISGKAAFTPASTLICRHVRAFTNIGA